MSRNFRNFFAAATGGHLPYNYQCRLGCGERGDKAEELWLSGGTTCSSQLISIPTGLGKTSAVFLAWLWNRFVCKDPAWPRRLVYCLPMRTLVEQTEEEVRKWIAAVIANGESQLDLDEESLIRLDRLQKNSPVILMGGEESGEWDIYPEREAILIGTQDMLLSRALNRGYGMSRYRWPMHFGLLNNDCLWVMDETQLMGVGVETSAQLDGFRHRKEWRLNRSCPTWWMSATLESARFETVDHPMPSSGWPFVALSDEERAAGRAQQLLDAKKFVVPCHITLNSTTKEKYPRELAGFIKQNHKPGTLTLVVVNRVKRAREIYEALTGGKLPLYDPRQVALIHSRFRPADRERHSQLLFNNADRIVIATQAVEAGVDVSARLLITELAPWSSIVQRVGRCNRQAELDDAQVMWVDIQPKDEKDELILPYTPAELDKARFVLTTLKDASPRVLSEIIVQEAIVIRPVIRRRDLVDLFDTTPDLCGQDLDVSRYIRDGEDNDVQFFWREFQDDSPTKDEASPERQELCRVSIGDAMKFLSKVDAWTWNPLEGKWDTVKRPRPGGVYLVNANGGGYHDLLGWTGDIKHKPTSLSIATGIDESYDADDRTYIGEWQTLPLHSQAVAEAVDAISFSLALDAGSAATLHTAALWHDIGKAHEVFQRMLRGEDSTLERTIWAKSNLKGRKCSRPGFRHELASALAWLQVGLSDAPDRDLTAYLIAAHHGRVRLSIRSLPNEPEPPEKQRLFARGIWQGDVLPELTLGDLTIPAVTLDLGFMTMGEGPHGPSWLARTVALRDRLGPFRLAFLETVLRAADAIASSKHPSKPGP